MFIVGGIYFSIKEAWRFSFTERRAKRRRRVWIKMSKVKKRERAEEKDYRRTPRAVLYQMLELVGGYAARTSLYYSSWHKSCALSRGYLAPLVAASALGGRPFKSINRGDICENKLNNVTQSGHRNCLAFPTTGWVNEPSAPCLSQRLPGQPCYWRGQASSTREMIKKGRELGICLKILSWRVCSGRMQELLQKRCSRIPTQCEKIGTKKKWVDNGVEIVWMKMYWNRFWCMKH